MDSIRVLFICSGNDCLSPMAEGFLRRYGGEAFEVMSAGLSAKALDPMAVEVMHRSGVDIRAHRGRSITEFADEAFDFVINLCERSRDAIRELPNGARFIHWRFLDPQEPAATPAEQKKRYLRARDEVASRIRLFAYAQTRRIRSAPAAVSLAG